MKKKGLLIAGAGLLFAPFAINQYYNSICPELPKEVIKDSSARALPSFARQTGFTCSTCHTIPPRLNKYGMMFKMKGYTEGNAIGSIKMDDQYSILKVNPISARVVTYPYSKKKGQDSEVIFPDEFMVVLAGRISENVGAVLEPLYEAEEGKWDIEFARIAAVKNFGTTLVGLVGGWTSPTGTDPFISLDYHGRRLTRQKAVPHAAITNTGLQDIYGFNNRGLSAYAYIANTLYANVGVYTGSSRLENEAIGVEEDPINKKGEDPLDFYGRLALTPPVGIADINIGGFIYAGTDELQKPDGTPLTVGSLTFEENRSQRLGIDLGVQKYLPGNLMVELLALYISGTDRLKETGGEVKVNHGGFNLSGTVYWKNKIALSVIYGEYRFNDDNPLTDENEQDLTRKDLTLHTSFMVRPNVRLGAEYTRTSYSKTKEETDITSLLVDFSF